MAQPNPSLVPETPEAQQETVVGESSTNPRTTGQRAPPPRNLDSDGVCDEYGGGRPDDDEVSLVTQAHGLAGAGIAVACLALRRCALPPRRVQAFLGLWYRRWSWVL